MFCVGVCFYASIVLLPQRFQTVNGLSPMSAGIHLLPFTIASPVFSIVCGFVLEKAQRTAAYLVGIGAALIVVGIALLGSLPTEKDTIVAAVYGYEIILAAGTGFIMPPLVFMLKVEFDDDDLGMLFAYIPYIVIILTLIYMYQPLLWAPTTRHEPWVAALGWPSHRP